MLVTGEWQLVCHRCGTGALQVSPGGIALLRGFVVATPGAVTDAGAETGLLRELEAVHARLIAMHLEKDLRSARVVRELRPQL